MALLVFVTFLLLLLPLSLSDPTTTLVYKGCANQSFGVSGGVSPSSLAVLSSTLISHSTTTHFFKTTTTTTSPSLFGLFQCLSSLSPSACSACVRRLPSLWLSLCDNAVAARVHLASCYGLYEVSGFPQVSGTKMLFKACDPRSGEDGFEVKRNSAFAGLQSGFTGSEKGWGEVRYEGVYAMAQCEGDLSLADCGECVAEAIQKAEVECGNAAGGGMFLARCFLTYGSYGKGVPREGGGGGGGGGGSGQPTGKTVAIVVGGAAGLGFLVICLLFGRSLYKKKDDY